MNVITQTSALSCLTELRSDKPIFWVSLSGIYPDKSIFLLRPWAYNSLLPQSWGYWQGESFSEDWLYVQIQPYL